ncbi:MAG TPA: T9SS type A sorting domain-containing protein [Bacteroidales bacterium]|nr:T9SS type A sorting domain-containing protein [Bacteroidales bacterium]
MKNVLTFVLFYIIIFQSNAQNLITNPGFESWQKINKPDGWTTALACTKDSAVIYSGAYSCKQVTATDSKELGQLIPVTPGSQYTISFWYRNDPAGTGNGCRIWSNWKDIDGNSISDDASIPLLHSGYLNSDSWVQYAAEVTAPADAHFFNLIIRTLPNSITFWDDVLFEESIPTGLHESVSDDIIIYPVPAHNYLNISNIQNIQRIDIQTITGKRIWSQKINNEENMVIPLSGIKDGIYIVYLNRQGKIHTRKFIKISY